VAVSFRSLQVSHSSLTRSHRIVDLLAQASNSTSPIALDSDLATLEASLQQVADMVDRVLSYVRSVLAGEVEGDVAVGRYLMDTLSMSTAGIEKGKLEGLFNAHLQVSFSLLAEEACILMDRFRIHSWFLTWRIWCGRKWRYRLGWR
jgi:hypothetical protein